MSFQNNAKKLMDIPVEVWQEIFLFLYFPTLRNLYLTCKTLHKLLQNPLSIKGLLEMLFGIPRKNLSGTEIENTQDIKNIIDILLNSYKDYIKNPPSNSTTLSYFPTAAIRYFYSITKPPLNTLRLEEKKNNVFARYVFGKCLTLCIAKTGMVPKHTPTIYEIVLKDIPTRFKISPKHTPNICKNFLCYNARFLQYIYNAYVLSECKEKRNNIRQEINSHKKINILDCSTDFIVTFLKKIPKNLRHLMFNKLNLDHLFKNDLEYEIVLENFFEIHFEICPILLQEHNYTITAKLKEFDPYFSKYNLDIEKIFYMPGIIENLPEKIPLIKIITTSTDLLAYTPENKRFKLFQDFIHHSFVTAGNFPYYLEVMPKKDLQDFYKFIRCYCEKINKRYNYKNNPDIHSLLLKNIFKNTNEKYHVGIFCYISSIYMNIRPENRRLHIDHTSIKFVIANLLPVININVLSKALNQPLVYTSQRKRLLMSACKCYEIINVILENADDLIPYLKLLPKAQLHEYINDDIREKVILNSLRHKNNLDVFCQLPFETLVWLFLFKKPLTFKMFDQNVKKLFTRKIEQKSCNTAFFLANKLKFCLHQKKLKEIQGWFGIFKKNANDKKIITCFELLVKLTKTLQPSFLNMNSIIWDTFKKTLYKYLNSFDAETTPDGIKNVELKFIEFLKQFSKEYLDEKINNSVNFFNGSLKYIHAKNTLTKFINAVKQKYDFYANTSKPDSK